MSAEAVNIYTMTQILSHHMYKCGRAAANRPSSAPLLLSPPKLEHKTPTISPTIATLHSSQ